MRPLGDHHAVLVMSPARQIGCNWGGIKVTGGSNKFFRVKQNMKHYCVGHDCVLDAVSGIIFRCITCLNCCHCAGWYHIVCIKNREEYVAGVWPCFNCRTMPDNIAIINDDMRALTYLVKTLTESVQTLQTNQEKTAKNIAAKHKLYNDLLVQNAELRGRKNALYQDASETHWANFPKTSHTALIGSSIIRDIDATKLVNTQCISISVARSRIYKRKSFSSQLQASWPAQYL